MSKVTADLKVEIPQRSRKLSIRLKGDNPLKLECGEILEDPGATATSSSGETISVTVSGVVDTKTLGTYTLVYTADDSRDSISVERVVEVIDTTPPVISLAGPATTTISCGEKFEDPGATATDGCDGPLPVTITGTVDPNIPGEYVINYTASDKHENAATVQRSVIVGAIEDNPPTVVLNDRREVTIECGSEFTDSGATATSPCAGAMPVTTNGNVNTGVPGTYILLYSASSGESRAEASRAVIVVDTVPPVMSLIGENPMKLELGQSFIDPGATARDGCAGNFKASATGVVDSTKVGSYTITYRAADPSGNEAVPIHRTVMVEAPRK